MLKVSRSLRKLLQRYPAAQLAQPSFLSQQESTFRNESVETQVRPEWIPTHAVPPLNGCRTVPLETYTPAPASAPAPAPVSESNWRSYYPPQFSEEVDIAKYDLPQAKSALEWWYYNAHLKSKKTNKPISCFASFFRQVNPSSVNKETPDFFSAVTWALSDVGNQRYFSDSLLDPLAPEVLAAKLDPKTRKLNHLEKALLEMVKQRRLPQPDRLMKSAQCSNTELDLQFDDITLRKVGHNYIVKLSCARTNTAAELTFVPNKGVFRHGFDGVVNDMFYYFIPRCAVTGWVRFGDDVHEVEGDGWYDREFGGQQKAEVSRDALDAWTWFSVQLSDNSEFTLFVVEDRDSGENKANVAVYCSPSGERIPIADFTVECGKQWTSMVTYTEYPVEWVVTVPELDMKINLRSSFQDQEFVTLLVTGGGFYEGRVHASGTCNGAEVTGVGFLERKNHKLYGDTKGLLKSVSKVVHKSLSSLYPLEASKEWIDEYALGRNAMCGVNPKTVCDVLFRPVRSLIDRGGKAWRSLILVSCINAIAKQNIDCSKYIAIAELMHVGSLIIDDIQDNSSVRRGGQCVHIEYGVAHAINAGTACYFFAPKLAGLDKMEPRQQLEMYKLYFDALRAGHAGQGLDIYGLKELMPLAVETGDVKALNEALQAIHVYKTGGPAGTLCRMGCIIGDATEEQTNLVEKYGIALGLAFQIVDDALNLRGFEGDLKELGEDIRHGKITYPVVRGLPKLSLEQRRLLWNTLKEGTKDDAVVKSVIDMLNSVGAIDDCLKEARDIVEDAWQGVDKVIPDSLPKLMMRAFTLFLTERGH